MPTSINIVKNAPNLPDLAKYLFELVDIFLPPYLLMLRKESLKLKNSFELLLTTNVSSYVCGTAVYCCSGAEGWERKQIRTIK